MASAMWVAIGVCSIIGNTAVRIIKELKSGRKFSASVNDLGRQIDVLATN